MSWSVVRIRWRDTGQALSYTDHIRYLVERAGKRAGDIGLQARRLQYLGADGSITNEKPCAYQFASYFELYRGLLDAFGTKHYHLSNEVAYLTNGSGAAMLSLTDGQTLAADLVVCADGSRSTGRRICGARSPPPIRGLRGLARHRRR